MEHTIHRGFRGYKTRLEGRISQNIFYKTRLKRECQPADNDDDDNDDKENDEDDDLSQLPGIQNSS